MYGMDFRQYDPAIGRWMVIDPVIHYSVAPYVAFDNNPTFWADPSGADSESFGMKDGHGRDRFDESGNFITPNDRNGDGGPITDFFEKIANKKDVGEFLTDKEFKKEYNQSIEILLWDKTSAFDLGHTAIRINGIVYGYYPSDVDGNGVYDKSDLSNSTGEMHIDDAQQFKSSYHGAAITAFTIKVSGSQKKALINELNNKAKNPGKYELTGNQCTSVALQAMAEADVRIKINGGLINNMWNFYLKVSPNTLRAQLEHGINRTIVQNKKTFIVK